VTKKLPNAFFITGTDTDAGKTFAACSILTAARQEGLTTAAVKPVAAGVIDTPQGKMNEDVLQLSQYCSLSLPSEIMNPACFDEPIAPHIAANRTGRRLFAGDLAMACQQVLAIGADLTLIEGAGGWKVPLNDSETMADIARYLALPVIMVVGMRLGCLNHALLTAQAIEADGLKLAGWIANQTTCRMDYYQENLETLKRLLSAPLLAEIPQSTTPEAAAASIQLDTLLSQD
jgi:dethiobiotin synthetase